MTSAHARGMLLACAWGASIGWGAAALWAQPTNPRPRARDLGLAPGVFATGAANAITDVDGVRVGHVTLATGGAVRTGTSSRTSGVRTAAA